jgi:two-component system, sensor histidine kinase and response regulator
LSKGIIDPSKGDQYKKTISDLLKTTDEVFLLLENLLAWSVSESDDKKIVTENIQLRDVVVSMVNLFQIAISDKNINLEINIAPEHVVFADLNMIKTVIRNLFSNAIKITPSEGKIVFDSWIDGDFIKTGVSDTGKGMHQEMIEFFLGPDNDTVTDPKQDSGNGLGLKLCKDFIEKNRGKIWIESDPERGTSVFFTLPCRNNDSEMGTSETLIW